MHDTVLTYPCMPQSTSTNSIAPVVEKGTHGHARALTVRLMNPHTAPHADVRLGGSGSTGAAGGVSDSGLCLGELGQDVGGH